MTFLSTLRLAIVFWNFWGFSTVLSLIACLIVILNIKIGHLSHQTYSNRGWSTFKWIHRQAFQIFRWLLIDILIYSSFVHRQISVNVCWLNFVLILAALKCTPWSITWIIGSFYQILRKHFNFTRSHWFSARWTKFRMLCAPISLINLWRFDNWKVVISHKR